MEFEFDQKEKARALYREGYYLFKEKKYAEALPILKEASDLGHGAARAFIAMYYQYGLNGFALDRAQALCWYVAVQFDEHSESRNADWSSVKKIIEDKLLRKDENGYIMPRPQGAILPEELYRAGLMLRECPMIPQGMRMRLSKKYLRVACEMDYAPACYEMALCTNSRIDAEAYCEKAIRLGHEEAHKILPELRVQAEKEREEKEREEQEKKARMQRELEKNEAFREGVEAYERKDYSTSVARFAVAAQLGSVTAMKNLCILYGDASLNVYNPRESFQWAQRAAETGDAESQITCAMKVLYGEGTIVDADEALRWFTEAAKTKPNEKTDRYIPLLQRFTVDLADAKASNSQMDRLICDIGWDYDKYMKTREAIPDMTNVQRAILFYHYAVGVSRNAVSISPEKFCKYRSKIVEMVNTAFNYYQK